MCRSQSKFLRTQYRPGLLSLATIETRHHRRSLILRWFLWLALSSDCSPCSTVDSCDSIYKPQRRHCTTAEGGEYLRSRRVKGVVLSQLSAVPATSVVFVQSGSRPLYRI